MLDKSEGHTTLIEDKHFYDYQVTDYLGSAHNFSCKQPREHIIRPYFVAL
jgi:hypothetical protein